MPNEKDKPEPKKPTVAADISLTPVEIAANFRKGCERAGGKFITVDREHLLRLRPQ